MKATTGTAVQALTNAFLAHEALLRAKFRRSGTEFDLSPRHCEILSALAILGAAKAGAIAEELYPDCDPEHARVRFKVYVHHIRRKMGKNAVTYEAGSYGLPADAQLDFRRLERLAAADFADMDSAEDWPGLVRLADAVEAFRRTALRRGSEWEWFYAHAIRLHDLAHGIAIRICKTLLQSGQTAEVIRLADGLLNDDDYDEEAREIKLLALIASKQFARVLKEYRRYDKAMREELGIGARVSLQQLVGGANAI